MITKKSHIKSLDRNKACGVIISYLMAQKVPLPKKKRLVNLYSTLVEYCFIEDVKRDDYEKKEACCDFAFSLIANGKVSLKSKVKRTRKKTKVKRVSSKSFYSSWAWKKLRFEVIKTYGATCMCCGSDKNIVVDHIKPRSKFPDLELDFNNMQILCNQCNMGKSNDDFTDFRDKVKPCDDIDAAILRSRYEYIE